MSQTLQIKAILIDLESKLDKNSNPYFRLSLQDLPNRYFYTFSFSLQAETLTALNTPQNFPIKMVMAPFVKSKKSKYCKCEDWKDFVKSWQIQIL